MPRLRARSNTRNFATMASLLIACVGLLAQQGAAVGAGVEGSDEPEHGALSNATQAIGTVPEGIANLTLIPGALLQMDVYGTPEMSARLRIDAQGEVTVPLIGLVRISGQSVVQAQATIAKALLEHEMLKDPQVNLNLLQYPTRHISVVGEVRTPGAIDLVEQRSLSEVLALAGGITTAAGGEIEVQRANASGQIESQQIALTMDQRSLGAIAIQPGDTVVVHRAGVIYVLGSVNRPGGYRMVNGGALNVVQAVALAGGEALQASTRWAIIVRQSDRRIEQIRIPLHKMETGELAAAQLQLNDALYIPTSNWKSAMMSGSSVLSAAAAASIYSAANHP